MSRSIIFGLIVVLSALCLSQSAHSKGGLVPADTKARLAALNARLGIDTPWQHLRDEAIDPDDYECDANTDLRNWIAETVGAIDPAVLGALGSVGTFDWPTYYSLLLDNDSSDDYFGVDGEHTKELIKRHKDNQRFWDVPTDDILLMGMHGAVIANDAKMVPTVQLVFLFAGIVITPAQAQAIVDQSQAVIESSIGYDHPLFTLNAFAFSAEGAEIVPGLGIIPDKIVMGEGILEALEDIGLGTNAPDFVHAHEFAHHVQYELGTLGEHTPEETRRAELMADAFGAYYLAHARGATFQKKRIVDAVSAAYGIGDCAFDSPGHHGTPNQREAATIWGAELAASAQKQGKIKSATVMLALFEAELPNLVAPDAN